MYIGININTISGETIPANISATPSKPENVQFQIMGFMWFGLVWFGLAMVISMDKRNETKPNHEKSSNLKLRIVSLWPTYASRFLWPAMWIL